MNFDGPDVYLYTTVLYCYTSHLLRHDLYG
jgi:hypothetical protein